MLNNILTQTLTILSEIVQHHRKDWNKFIGQYDDGNKKTKR